MGKRLSNYEEEKIVFNQEKYENLLAETKKYIKVKPIDSDRTIQLINRIKEDRGTIAFTSAIGTISRIQLFRIYKEGNKELQNATVAGILSAKLPGCNVTLDEFMDAQGKIRIEKQDEYKSIHNKELRQILEYTLLRSGYEIKMSDEYKEKSQQDDQSCFSIRIIQPKEYVWDFEIKNIPYTGKKIDDPGTVNDLLLHLVTESVRKRKADRYSIIIDNESVYRELKEKAESIRLPSEVSVILISALQRTVTEEYVIRSSEESTIRTNLFPDIVPPAHTPSVSSLEERYKTDCQAIIMDDLLQKGNAIRIASTENTISLFHFINLRIDLSLCITGDNTETDLRSYFIKDICDYKEYSGISQSIHEWLLETISCFYTGKLGAVEKISLVVNQPALYQEIAEEIAAVNIPDRISVILVDTMKRDISSEKNNPYITNPEQKTSVVI